MTKKWKPVIMSSPWTLLVGEIWPPLTFWGCIVIHNSGCPYCLFFYHQNQHQALKLDHRAMKGGCLVNRLPGVHAPCWKKASWWNQFIVLSSNGCCCWSSMMKTVFSNACELFYRTSHAAMVHKTFKRNKSEVFRFLFGFHFYNLRLMKHLLNKLDKQTQFLESPPQNCRS